MAAVAGWRFASWVTHRGQRRCQTKESCCCCCCLLSCLSADRDRLATVPLIDRLSALIETKQSHGKWRQTTSVLVVPTRLNRSVRQSDGADRGRGWYTLTERWQQKPNSCCGLLVHVSFRLLFVSTAAEPSQGTGQAMIYECHHWRTMLIRCGHSDWKARISQSLEIRRRQSCRSASFSLPLWQCPMLETISESGNFCCR